MHSGARYASLSGPLPFRVMQPFVTFPRQREGTIIRVFRGTNKQRCYGLAGRAVLQDRSREYVQETTKNGYRHQLQDQMHSHASRRSRTLPDVSRSFEPVLSPAGLCARTRTCGTRLAPKAKARRIAFGAIRCPTWQRETVWRHRYYLLGMLWTLR